MVVGTVVTMLSKCYNELYNHARVMSCWAYNGQSTKYALMLYECSFRFSHAGQLPYQMSRKPCLIPPYVHWLTG